MSHLYVSDLDGTLLNKRVELSTFTIDTINSLVDQGMNFTIATARTAASATKIMENVKLRLPAILMNGVAIYDMSQHRYIHVETMKEESVNYIIKMLRYFQIRGFMYTLEEHELLTYYEELDTIPLREFYEERCKKYYKAFAKVGDFLGIQGKKIIYFTLLDTRGKLEPIWRELSKDCNLELTFYKDIYGEDLWYLEVFSVKASKGRALDYIRNNYGFTKVTAFGDNLNDLPLFHGSEIRCAVGNAKEELKELADFVIGSNEENGVARFLLKENQ